jgi:hypothetical protein
VREPQALAEACCLAGRMRMRATTLIGGSAAYPRVSVWSSDVSPVLVRPSTAAPMYLELLAGLPVVGISGTRMSKGLGRVREWLWLGGGTEKERWRHELCGGLGDSSHAQPFPRFPQRNKHSLMDQKRQDMFP